MDSDEITPVYPENQGDGIHGGNRCDLEDSSDSEFNLSDKIHSSNTDSEGSQVQVGQDTEDAINVTLRSHHHAPLVDESTISQTNFENASNAFSKKRKYNYINRKRREKEESGMRKRWKSNMLSPEEIKELQCCRKKCFSSSNADYLSQKIKFSFSITSSERRAMLSNMLASNGKYYYDGNMVCSSFLLHAFNFSRDLQASIKKAPNRYVDRSAYNRKAKMRDSIIDIVNRLAELTADKMPDKSHVHLPFTRKNDVFKHVISEFRDLYGPQSNPPSVGYISSIWKTYCSHVKVRKKSRFTVCTICEEVRVALETAVKNKADTSGILSRKRLHMDHVSQERLEYRRKRNNAIRDPSKYCSLIVDGADQSAYGLPHFVTTTKDVHGQAMKVRLIGVLEHASLNTLRLYSMTEEHKTGANHIVESIHRTLNDIAMVATLPPCLYIQADNCFRENKNRYLFAFVESMVAWKLFDEVEVAFLPKGHTHEDIDQSFSATSNALAHHNAVTLRDMHDVLRSTYNRNTQVSHMKQVINWSQLCENSVCLNGITNFTNYQYFKFVSRGTGEQLKHTKVGKSSINRWSKNQETQTRLTACFVKHACNAEWMELTSEGPLKGQGFLKFTPNLANTPPLQIAELSGIDDINKRLNSEEQRINSTDKMRQLYELRDYIYKKRTERFHWNLKQCVELKGRQQKSKGKVNKCDPNDVLKEKETVCTLKDQVRNDFEYTVGDLVATLIEDDSGCPFWIAKVNKTIRNKDGIVSCLIVQWLELVNSNNVFSGTYRLAKRITKKKTEVDWTDKISADSVIVTFSKLTQSQQLPMSVQQHLRQVTNNPDVI